MALVKLTGDSGFKMALGSYPKLVMMTGTLYFHVDKWLGVAILERTAAKSGPEEADVLRAVHDIYWEPHFLLAKLDAS